MSLPKEFVQRNQNDPFIDESLLNALETQSPVSIRRNPFKTVAELPVSGEIPWSKNAFYLSERPSFTKDPLFHAGTDYPQEAGSMFLDSVLKQLEMPENPMVLNLCAAPGGKSTLMASFLNNKGLLVSNEVIQSRSRILKGNMMIKASGDITVYAGQEINLKPGFHSQQGSVFHAYIDYGCYPTGGKSQQNTQNDSKVSRKAIINELGISQSEGKIENEHVDISIFPNPSKAEVTVLFPDNLEGNFEIVNSIGAIIQKNIVPSDYKSILKLESGIYFLHYQSTIGHKLTKKIIIL